MLSSNKVLIVDDNAELAENVADILATAEGLSIETHVAKSGAEATAVARELGPELSLLLVDRRLPDIDGAVLVGELRKSCPLAEAIIITADAKIESVAAAVGQGFAAYLLKPFEAQDLLSRVEAALTRFALVREREALREKLEESEQRHRQVVEAVPALVMALGPGGEVQLWNRSLEGVTGYSRGEMLGKPGREIVGSGGERKLFLKNGGHRLIRWQLAEVPGAGDQATSFAVGIDVTAERAMQRRTVVAERLAAVGTLAAGLAHEVRNPLNSATLQLQVLRRRLERGQSSADALLPVVEIVHDEIRRLDRLVSDFLAFARPNPLDLKPTELAELAHSVIEQLRPEAGIAHVVIESRIEEPGLIDGDRERLRQVLINLMRNGIEAMATTGGVLTVAVRTDSEGLVEALVEDTGPGIGEDAPIFDAFYTTKEAGTGLGLAIVHRIVHEHGGTIQYESRRGRTCFTLRFPAAVQAG